MSKYQVVVSKFESMTVEVDADDEHSAEDEALTAASDCWEPDTRNWQLDGVDRIEDEPQALVGAVAAMKSVADENEEEDVD